MTPTEPPTRTEAVGAARARLAVDPVALAELLALVDEHQGRDGEPLRILIVTPAYDPRAHAWLHAQLAGGHAMDLSIAGSTATAARFRACGLADPPPPDAQYLVIAYPPRAGEDRRLGVWWSRHPTADFELWTAPATPPERPPRSIPPAFRDGYASVPTDRVTFGIIEAVQRGKSGKRWTDHDGQTEPMHGTRMHKRDGAVLVSVHSPDDGPQLRTREALWQLVSEMDDLTSDVLLACMAHWTRRATDPEEAIYVTADALLDARGVKRIRKADENANWQHGHRQEDRHAVGRALFQLQYLTVELARVDPAPGKKAKGRGPITLKGRVLEMPLWSEQADAAGRAILLWAKIRLGPWARALDVRQTSLVAQSVLAYDPYREQVEKRLGKYVLFHFRINANHRDVTLRRAVASLLEGADIAPSKTDPQRTRDRLEKALNRLAADAVIGGWSYAAAPELPARGWLPVWLTWAVDLEPPAALREHFATLGKRGAPGGPEQAALQAGDTPPAGRDRPT